MRYWLLLLTLGIGLSGCSYVYVTNYHQHHLSSTYHEIKRPVVENKEEEEKEIPPLPILEEIPSERLNDKDFVIERLLDHIDELNDYIEENHAPP